jgi:electron transfer flavoprotein beta subunit
MKIVVCIKQTFDTEARITLSHEGRIDDSSVLLIMNPYDEYALEEAIRLKEKNGGEVTVVTVGDQRARKTLQHGLAMGADNAVLVDDPDLKDADAHIYALVLSRFIQSVEYDLIMCGKESIDEGASQVHTRLAELLDLPQVNIISALRIEEGKAEVRRDVDGGNEIIKVDLPAIFSAQKGLNEVRYPSMRRIMQANKMPIKTLCLANLGLTEEDVSPFSKVEEFTFPKPRQAGNLLSGDLSEVVSQAVRYLQQNVKVI